jgi:hypothetical protein
MMELQVFVLEQFFSLPQVNCSPNMPADFQALHKLQVQHFYCSYTYSDQRRSRRRGLRQGLV